ncbi:MAG: RidA family protein [Nitrosopumilaceae archaeon]|nr:RidA family protein [Nitrosopumilaceae archaeon]NIU00566.1 RidA family protein [Nitrosopumilaceae archaeon]NIU86952.1 RidA family protein [Nitrosopumilaceae archaeon]NIV66416.1 RidA family protein [Nitrosopumilaceae archaeon]NIX61168.1 RidA family protein [Nitrosopumilaceae archaeon]
MIEERLADLGITIPEAPAPAGSYIPVVISRNLAFVSGQVPIKDGKIAFTGKVSEANLEDAKKSAKLCLINILSQLKRELGTLDRISRVVRLSGFVNCGDEFSKHPKVINAASDLLYEIFGEKGIHSRIAIGAPSLPLNSMTEIDAIVEIS